MARRDRQRLNPTFNALHSKWPKSHTDSFSDISKQNESSTYCYSQPLQTERGAAETQCQNEQLSPPRGNRGRRGRAHRLPAILHPRTLPKSTRRHSRRRRSPLSIPPIKVYHPRNPHSYASRTKHPLRFHLRLPSRPLSSPKWAHRRLPRRFQLRLGPRSVVWRSCGGKNPRTWRGRYENWYCG